MSQERKLKILETDPLLVSFEGDLDARMDRYENALKRLLKPGQSLAEFAEGAMYFGFHRTPKGWVYREWAPAAKALHLIGDFNGWNRESHPLKKLDNGNWEIELEGADALPNGSRVKVQVTSDRGTEDRIPLYATYVIQNDETKAFDAAIWAPEKPFQWTDGDFHPAANVPPLIYEAHVGMATEEERVGTYAEFARDILPRIRDDGYNTVQLMAIMEHPYYGSFGYQVSNFFAASSRYGTPDELKALINRAHELGLSVLLDIVHSHAVKNTAEGISGFDGTDGQFFKDGPAGYHPAWDSRVFDYGKTGVIHFLLSNVRFWLEEYHFDGFRFDGVTSMLYHDHGLGSAFTDYKMYFSMNTDVDAVTYLQLAMNLTKEIKPESYCIAEDMSGMPGMCRPVAEGGIGFDARLGMGLPDYWIKTIKERPFGQWDIGRIFYEMVSHRPGEKTIAYSESHDQALVGDKTIMFRLADKEMYWGMSKMQENMVVTQAESLHKMIRLVTATAGGDGYLNFMGNEFGHPEWIDFPREGNGWSYAKARRLWSLSEREDLRYIDLGRFDKAMISLIRKYDLLSEPYVMGLLQHEDHQILIYERKGCVFAFNFHPSMSQQAQFVPIPDPGEYKVILSSDDRQYGGFDNISDDTVYQTAQQADGQGFYIYLPAQTAVVLRKAGTI